ncbi:UDP-N-acetylmuramoyl-L-alanine--D-glutamate ligase [Verrucomicrobiaceae bacterium 227]
MLDLTGKTVAVLGAGRSGQAAARLAVHCGAAVTVYDTGEITSVPDGCDAVSRATVETGESVKVDLVVVSPGIETGGDFVQAFASGSGALWGEIELAWRCYSGKTIAITGTNGKTTTTELVDVLVRATGRTCAPCGNYGIPFAEVVLREDVPEVVSLELSSFQLESVVDFKPDAVVFLNFAPDHMDRYKSVEEYREAKLQIFKNTDQETPVISRQGNDLGQFSGKLVTFSTDLPADWIFRDGEILSPDEKFITLEETRLRGLHNAENLMAACAVVDGLTPGIALAALSKYSPPVHRCELVSIIDGVEYLNDSKATNLHALESALRSQVRPTILIAGGKQKGLDYQGLAPLLSGKCKRMICFGEIGPALAVTFFDAVPCETVDTLDEAVAIAARAAQPGDTVLLSPGTSSFDQFSGYEARGDAYKSAVRRITKTQ